MEEAACHWEHHPGWGPSSGFVDGSGSALGVPALKPLALHTQPLSPGLSGQAWDLAGAGRDREGVSLGALPPAARWATREGAS